MPNSRVVIMPTVNLSLDNVLSRSNDISKGKDLNDDHTVTTKGTSMCSSMRSSRSSISSPFSSDSEPRKVYFPENASEIVGRVQRREDLSKEERFETWWTTTEFQAIRLAAKFTTKQVRKCDQDGIEKIETGFNTALHISCTASDEKLEAVLRSPPESLYQPLEGWCKRKAPVRGLEKYISNLQKELRLHYVSEARSAVVSMAKGGEHDTEDISMIYKEYSRHALVYSRFLGHTDMLAAREEDEPEPERKPRRLERTLSRLNLGRQASQRKIDKLDSESLHKKMQRQASQRQLGRQASQRQLGRQPSQRQLGRQASQKQLGRQASRRNLQREPSMKKLREDCPMKMQRESSTKRLVREMSSKKLQSEGTYMKLQDDDDEPKMRRQPSLRKLQDDNEPKMRRQPSLRKLSMGSMHRQCSQRSLRDSVTKVPLDPEILEENL